MADKTEKHGRSKTHQHDPGSGKRHQDNGSPSPSDMDFFNDPVIYEQGDVTRAARETHEKHGTESGSGALGNRRPDEEIQAEIEGLMAFQKTIDASAIRVVVKDGLVTLLGNVGSPYDKQVAENITRNVLGIREVDNLLNMKGQM